MVAEVSHQRSTLNPNAPIFVPEVYRSVEDFSPKWWDLVKSCSWFRDYWLSLHPDGQVDDDVVVGEEFEFVDDVAFDDFGSDDFVFGLKIDVKDVLNDVIVPKSPKKPLKSPRSTAGISKFQMKPAYSVSPKCTPRRINQPR